MMKILTRATVFSLLGLLIILLNRGSSVGVVGV